MENPQQPLIQFDPNVPVTNNLVGGPTMLGLQPRGLQLNLNKLNTISTSGGENALPPQQPASIFDVLKPVALPQQAHHHHQRSPKEPSPPKLKLYQKTSINSLKNLLPPQPVAQPQPLQQNFHIQQNNQQPAQPVLSRIPRFLKLDIKEPIKEDAKQVVIIEQPAEIAKEIGEAAEVVVAEEEEEIEDIDKSQSRDAVLLVCDIAKDIYDYMFQLEEKQFISQDYLREQKIFTPKVRHRLINWCIDIHSQLKLLPETLYLTIAVIDRFFDKVQVKQQSQVQLVAVGSTLIASKYEEIYPPDVGDLMHLTQNNYTRREIMRIEIQILEQLDFDLGRPIPLAFLRRFSKAAHCDTKMHCIAKYLMELSLCEYECSHWRPSMLAAAALYTSINLSQSAQSPSFGVSLPRLSVAQQQRQPTQELWTKSLVHYTRYTRQQLQEPAAILCKVLKKAQKTPQSYTCAKKNLHNLAQWPELKSAKVDKLIRQGEQQQQQQQQSA